MANGKKPLLRELISGVQVAIGKIQMQNENQDKKMDILSEDFKEHKISSDPYRIKAEKNEQAIEAIHKQTMPPIRKALYGLYGLLGAFLLTGIGAFIRYIMK